MSSMACFSNSSHLSSLPLSLAPRPVDLSSRAWLYSEEDLSADASNVWRCLISSIHLPLSEWSASVGVEQATRLNNTMIGNMCFMLVFIAERLTFKHDAL